MMQWVFTSFFARLWCDKPTTLSYVAHLIESMPYKHQSNPSYLGIIANCLKDAPCYYYSTNPTA